MRDRDGQLLRRTDCTLIALQRTDWAPCKILRNLEPQKIADLMLLYDLAVRVGSPPNIIPRLDRFVLSRDSVAAALI